jgi:16S rRNA (guanine966-N2)-methyltransferase
MKKEIRLIESYGGVMRIIAGQFRGRTIKSVAGMSTRPTLDQVKEAVFNSLGQFFTGGTVLDLYAGSGNLGLEALSRGYEKAIFVDQSFQAVQVIKENIKSLQLESTTVVYKMNATTALKQFGTKQIKFDLVFLDPPYEKQQLNEVIESLMNHHLVSQTGMIVCETAKAVDLMDEFEDLYKIKEASYGATKITIFKRGEGYE